MRDKDIETETDRDLGRNGEKWELERKKKKREGEIGRKKAHTDRGIVRDRDRKTGRQIE